MFKKKLVKTAAALTLAASMVFGFAGNVLACTGFYMGKDTTANGSTIFGRTEDTRPTYSKLFTVVPAETHAPGDMFVSSSGFTWKYPAQTLRYTICKDSVYNESATPEPYGEVGTNEKNVSITATVSLNAGHTAIVGTRDNNYTDGIDARVTTGLSEQDIATVVLMQATSAKQAIELIAEIIDQEGYNGRDGIMVSDVNEVWYMEVVSGHQYVAVKAPTNQIGFSPNLATMGVVDLSDTENVIASADLVNIPTTAGTLVTDTNGNINVAESYFPAKTDTRMKLGYFFLKGAEAADALDNQDYYDYFTDAREGGDYTLYEAMKLLAYHGEGTSYPNSRPIGYVNTLEAHVFEIRHNMPDALATMQWIAMGPAEYSVYLPYYSSLITETNEHYWKYDSASFDEQSMYWVFRQLHTLCAQDPENYGTNVKTFWDEYQKKLIEQQTAIDADMVKIYAQDPELASQKATALGNHIAQEMYDYALDMLNELQDFVDNGEQGVFTPSVMTAGKLPTYSFEAVGGTGLTEPNPNPNPGPGNGDDGGDNGGDDDGEKIDPVNTGDATINAILSGTAILAAATAVACKRKKEYN